jgi:hypothetical protein
MLLLLVLRLLRERRGPSYGLGVNAAVLQV